MLYVFAFLSVAAVALFGFVSVAVWTDARRKEREAFYKNETMKKLSESPGGGEAAMALLREEARIHARRTREGQRLGGLLSLAVGIGVWVFLMMIQPDKPIYMAGLIPMLVGVVLVVYGYFLAPKPE